jgi:hypothetical protein
MRDMSLNRMKGDVRSLADRIGSQTTEALIRAASGVKEASGEGMTTSVGGAQHLGEQVGHDISERTQSLALPTPSARVAWRAGRMVGRIEGAVRLAWFGVRFWWRRRQREKHDQQGQPFTHWLRLLAQWGPAIIASTWLLAQMWTRRRRR